VCDPERFKKVIQRAELFLYDCKHMDPEEHKRLTGRDNAVILENLHSLFEARKDVRIRVPLMPGINDTEKNIAEMALFLHKHGRYEIDVLPCHTFGYSKYDALNLPRPSMATYRPEELEAALERFARHDLKVTTIA
jgi:pyruvate formate lyase activating enzyme